MRALRWMSCVNSRRLTRRAYCDELSPDAVVGRMVSTMPREARFCLRGLEKPMDSPFI